MALGAAHGAAAVRTTLDIEEVQLLCETPEHAVYYYEHQIGLIRVSKSLWITANPDGEVLHEIRDVRAIRNPEADPVAFSTKSIQIHSPSFDL